MKIECDASLRAYMDEKGMHTIAVEVMSSQNSDFEVTELYVHLIRDRQVSYFKEKKRFRSVAWEGGVVLLPPYRLEYDETIRFTLKRFWIFRSVAQTGIRL